MKTEREQGMMNRRERGFTLMELMIVVAIIALIVAFGYPSYRQSVMESHRADAQIALTQTAQTLERCYAQYGEYDNDNCDIHDGDTFESPKGFYSITVKLTNTGNKATDPVGYKLTADPKGGQKDDDTCDQFILKDNGQQIATSEGGNTTSDECWG